MVLSPGFVFAESGCRRSVEPGVAIPTLKRDLVHVIVKRFVSIAKDRPLGIEGIEASPKRARSLLFDKMTSFRRVPTSHNRLVVDCMHAQPGNSIRDRGS